MAGVVELGDIRGEGRISVGPGSTCVSPGFTFRPSLSASTRMSMCRFIPECRRDSRPGLPVTRPSDARRGKPPGSHRGAAGRRAAGPARGRLTACSTRSPSPSSSSTPAASTAIRPKSIAKAIRDGVEQSDHVTSDQSNGWPRGGVDRDSDRRLARLRQRATLARLPIGTRKRWGRT